MKKNRSMDTKIQELLTYEITEERFYQIIESLKEYLPDDILTDTLALINTIALYKEKVFEQGMTINKFRKTFFPVTEKSRNILKPNSDKAQSETENKNMSASAETDKKILSFREKKKAPGHGKNPISEFTATKHVKHSHDNLKPGDLCPLGCGGHVYKMKERVFLKLIGSAPLQAEIHEREKVRCSSCGKIFTADLSDNTSFERTDPTANAITAINKYAAGVPFYRQEKINKMFGIPVSDSELWEMAEKVADCGYPVHEQLMEIAAQGRLFNFDDTYARILSIMAENKENKKGERKGTSTSGIVSKVDEKEIVLFFTGRNHAGENLRDILEKRKTGLPPPLAMADAAAKNFSLALPIVRANCNFHARKKFVELYENYPDECGYIITQYKEIFKNEVICKQQNMTDAERLSYHQKMSAPVIHKIREYAVAALDGKVEPQSTLGQAFNYLLKYWEYLTQFLKIEGCPIENNKAERILKKSILNRKNAMFFRTEHGAVVSDILMTLIFTAERMNVNPFDYLVAIQNHTSYVHAHPEKWLPWNYKETMNSIGKKLIAA